MKAASLLVLLAIASNAHALSGVVIKVPDGDTIWVRPDDGGKPVKLRLYGIDAPERCQPWGLQSRNALALRLMQRRVDVDTRARDDYQRTIGSVTLDGIDIGAWMVRDGHAWSPGYQRRLGPYAAQEQEARSAQRGLFASADAIEPRVFRKAHGPCR
jgi:micrococcal nuclease